MQARLVRLSAGIDITTRRVSVRRKIAMDRIHRNTFEPPAARVSLSEMLVVAVFVTVIIAVAGQLAGAAASIWKTYNYGPLILIFLIAIVSLWLGIRTGGASRYRARVISLAVVFLGIILLFAGVHNLLFRSNPKTYRVSDILVQSLVREDLDRIRREAIEYSRQIFAITLIEADAPKVFATIHSAQNSESRAGRCTLAESAQFQYSWFSNAQVILHDYKIIDRSGGPVVAFSSENFRSSPTDRLGGKLWTAKNAADVATSARDCVRFLTLLRDRRLRELDELSRLSASLDMTQFVYLSASIMTTIGSSDIVPASRASRILVTIQAFVAVFFIAFALKFLWPERYRKGDSASV